LAYVSVGQADYLVTGDQGLPSLGQVEHIQTVGSQDFHEVLERRLP